jgi:MoaA/NifB/PqqE/SkfB family radical SAM enzyme
MHITDLADVPNLVKLLRRGIPGKEIGFSFNVAERCPIGCQCYWRERLERMQVLGRDLAREELTEEAAVEFFHEMKRRGYMLVTLVGGEPYVRPNLLEKLTPIMPANWLVTSGTTPLRRFPRTQHFISIDGADAATHNRVRRSKGLFERIVRNVSKARAEGDFPAVAHTVLNAENYTQIGDILAFWSGNGLLDAVMFSTMTPIEDSGDDDFRLSREQREWIVEELLRNKQAYGSFVLNTTQMIEMFHPDHTATQSPSTCGTARLVASFDGAGKRIEKCILGGKADCTQCGCVITTMMETMFPRPSLGSIKMLATLRA